MMVKCLFSVTCCLPCEGGWGWGERSEGAHVIVEKGAFDLLKNSGVEWWIQDLVRLTFVTPVWDFLSLAKDIMTLRWFLKKVETVRSMKFISIQPENSGCATEIPIYFYFLLNFCDTPFKETIGCPSN